MPREAFKKVNICHIQDNTGLLLKLLPTWGCQGGCRGQNEPAAVGIKYFEVKLEIIPMCIL